MNNVPGMTFGLDGPSVTGWWVNPKTGDKFKAIDTFFEDNKLLVKTADGRLLDYNRLQNYVQTDKPDSIQVNNQNTTPKATIPQSVLNEIEQSDDKNDSDLLIPDDNIYTQGPLGNMYSAPAEQEPAKVGALGNTNVNNSDMAIVARALQSKTTPEISGKVTWKDFPQREIEMLVDVMNVSKDIIIEYYVSQISLDTIRNMVSSIVEGYIESKLNPVQEPVVEVPTKVEMPKTEVPKVTTTKKPATKPTTKKTTKKK